MVKPILVYHKGCPDGFGAAYAFYHKFKDEIEYYPMFHGDEILFDVTDRDIYFADISLSRQVTLELAQKAKSIIILDHHISQYESLKDLNYYNFSNENSGCVMSWKYLFPERPVPKILQFIEDRDLWQWKLPETEAVLSVLDGIKCSFDGWTEFDFRLNSDPESVIKEGKIILSYCQNLEEVLFRSRYNLQIKEYTVPAINTAFFKPEIACRLAIGVSFAAAYHFNGKEYTFSLRSIGDTDVSKIAARFGGGGHKNAAGFTIKSLDELK